MTLVKNIKTPAFTVIEMIVVITISGILISSAMMIYLNYQKMFNKTLKGIEQSSEFMLFDSRIQNDSENSDKFVFKNDQFIFQLYDSTEVSYQFLENYLVRTCNEHSDTTFFKIKDLSYSNYSGNLIKEIEFDIILNNNKFRYYLSKKYNNSTLVNFSLNNGN